MTDHLPLAALHAIRDLELEMARRVEAAEAAGAEAVRAARVQERALLAAAEQRGVAEADRRFEEAVGRARADAESIRTDGSARVAGLRESVDGRLGDLIDELVDLVVAPPLEEGK